MVATKQSSGGMAGALVYLLGLVGLCVALGVTSGSPWPGLLCFAGLVTLHVVASRATERKFEGSFFAMWLGAWAISAAGTLGEYGGRWLWAVPWVLAGLLLLGIAAAARDANKWVVQAGLILGLWSLAWAFVGPMWLYGLNQQETQQWMIDMARQWWWALLIGLVVASSVMAWATSRLGGPSGPQRPVRPEGISPGPTPRPSEDQVAFEQMLREIEQQVRLDEEQRERDRLHAQGGAQHDYGLIESKPPGVGATMLAPDAGGGTILAGNVGRVESPRAAKRGELLYTTPRAVVEALLGRGGLHYLLLDDGTLARWDGGALSEVPGVRVERPVGVAAEETAVVVAGRSGDLVEVRNAERGVPDLTAHHLGLSVAALALNPFGTIVAFAPVRRHDVLARLLGPSVTQTLAADVGAVSALAFSGDGRVLAIGLRDGAVVLLDMSTRRPMATQPPGSALTAAVTALRPFPGGGWVVGHADGSVARRDDALRLLATTTVAHPVTRLAVGPSSVAIGCADGRVVTEAADLSRVIAELDVSGEAVVGLALEPDDGTLVVVGHDGEVRRAVS